MFKQTDKITILGRSGCGKSFLSKRIQSAYPRKVIFDPMNEYTPGQEDVVVTSFYQFANWARFGRYSFRYTVLVKFPFDMPQEEIEKQFNEIIRVIYYMGDTTVVIEEIHEFCTTHKIPPFLRKAMTSGRHQEVGFIITTQRPGELHKTVLSQSTHVFVGNLIDENDINAAGSFLGREKKELSTLKDRNFIWYSPYKEPRIVKFSTENPKKIQQLTTKNKDLA